MTAEKIRHRTDCPDRTPYRTQGRHGDPMDRCRGCGRFAVVNDDALPRPGLPTVPTGTRYRCRDHGNPVTWRGKKRAKKRAGAR